MSNSEEIASYMQSQLLYDAVHLHLDTLSLFPSCLLSCYVLQDKPTVVSEFMATSKEVFVH